MQYTNQLFKTTLFSQLVASTPSYNCRPTEAALMAGLRGVGGQGRVIFVNNNKDIRNYQIDSLVCIKLIF
jgi:hypothetical protein